MRRAVLVEVRVRVVKMKLFLIVGDYEYGMKMKGGTEK